MDENIFNNILKKYEEALSFISLNINSRIFNDCSIIDNDIIFSLKSRVNFNVVDNNTIEVIPFNCKDVKLIYSSLLSFQKKCPMNYSINSGKKSVFAVFDTYMTKEKKNNIVDYIKMETNKSKISLKTIRQTEVKKIKKNIVDEDLQKRELRSLDNILDNINKSMDSLCKKKCDDILK